MIRVTLRTRRLHRRDRCCECDNVIAVGELYRELVAVQDDAFVRPFTRLLAHDGCVSGDRCWTLTTPTELHRRAVASMDYVRRAYNFTLNVGDRCTAIGELGIIRGADGGYVLVRLDKHKKFEGRYHPSDVQRVKEHTP